MPNIHGSVISNMRICYFSFVLCKVSIFLVFWTVGSPEEDKKKKKKRCRNGYDKRQKEKNLPLPSVLCSQCCWLTHFRVESALSLAKYCFRLERHIFRARGAHPRFSGLFMFPLFICTLFIWGNWERNACLSLFLSLRQTERIKSLVWEISPQFFVAFLSPVQGLVLEMCVNPDFCFFPPSEGVIAAEAVWNAASDLWHYGLFDPAASRSY